MKSSGGCAIRPTSKCCPKGSVVSPSSSQLGEASQKLLRKTHKSLLLLSMDFAVDGDKARTQQKTPTYSTLTINFPKFLFSPITLCALPTSSIEYTCSIIGLTFPFANSG